MKVVNKEELIDILENMSYNDDFLLTIEENDGNYFLKIVTEELNKREMFNNEKIQ